jgi:hypothetical protein
MQKQASKLSIDNTHYDFFAQFAVLVPHRATFSRMSHAIEPSSRHRNALSIAVVVHQKQFKIL